MDISGCMPMGVSAQGSMYTPYRTQRQTPPPAQLHAGIHSPQLTEQQTGVKTLPCPKLAGGKNVLVITGTRCN